MLHDDGVASCSSALGLASAAREGGGEAWVGVVQAEGSSREILRSPGCRRCTKKRKALSSAALARVVGEPRAVIAPRACTKLSVLGTGRPRGRPCSPMMPCLVTGRGVAGRRVRAVRGTLWR
jgi:hypothetical protein